MASRHSATRRAVRPLVLACLLLVGSLESLAAPQPAAARAACTNWTSTTQPPQSIWVHIPRERRNRLLKGTAVQVDFKTYVERVVAAEWGPSERSRAQLMTAALIVKQYAWWYVIHPSKGRIDRHKHCYDVGSTTNYQVYRPGATNKTSPSRLALIREAIDATWSLSLWRTRGKLQGFAHTGYLSGNAKKGCPGKPTGFRLLQQNARRCAKQGESFETLLRRYYGETIAIYDPRMATVAAAPAAARLWSLSPNRHLWSTPGSPTSAVGSVGWTDHGLLYPATPAGSSTLKIVSLAAPRVAVSDPLDPELEWRTGYDLVEVAQDAGGRPWVARLSTSSATAAADTLATPWSIPNGWTIAGDDLRVITGDFDGDLIPEIGILRLRTDDGSGVVSAELGTIERRTTGWSWRSEVWSVPDLYAAGVDPASMNLETGDFNGDGSIDIAILSATRAEDLVPPDPPTEVPLPGPTSVWLAASTPQRSIDDVTQDAQIAQPVRVFSTTDAWDAIRLATADRTGDGFDELFLIVDLGDDTVRIDLLTFPRAVAAIELPTLSTWWSSTLEMGAVDPASIVLHDRVTGIDRVRVARRNWERELSVELLLTGDFGGATKTFRFDGRAVANPQEITPNPALLPANSLSLAH